MLSATAGPSGHKHLVSVGTGTQPSTYDKTWTVTQVRTAIDNGNSFYTQTTKVAEVTKFDCACGIHTIRSHADGVWNNNLDNLPDCG